MEEEEGLLKATSQRSLPIVVSLRQQQRKDLIDPDELSFRGVVTISSSRRSAVVARLQVQFAKQTQAFHIFRTRQLNFEVLAVEVFFLLSQGLLKNQMQHKLNQ
uniref:Uncharacterized protein n=1 Tax=Sphaerodactylus townsendi TaxID=933632 RepID=A0ACB8FPW6_9SAUR